MIKIKEERVGENKNRKIFLNLDNHHELVFETYPIVIKARDFKHTNYEASIADPKIKA
ncbi:MAG: hypothetical protein R2685_08150 [Candidatus Nitrosocosmicus sp.]|jgi:hypothetical protein|nr:hypothetical protein [Candidatus Nitrosocosmicus sp.]